ncbi:MAG TPA: DUF302 domain-containing protein [Bacteroides sp.]|nr:DUF302 domain-containing protein [Bacteroides sp.]
MAYYIGKMTDLGFTEAVEKLTEELQKEGFGVITEINIQETLKKKLDLDFRPYIILGACNPHYAHQAIELDDKIGALLPCNFIVQESGDGTEVFAINPRETMGKLLGDEIKEISEAITTKVQNVLDRM